MDRSSCGILSMKLFQTFSEFLSSFTTLYRAYLDIVIINMLYGQKNRVREILVCYLYFVFVVTLLLVCSFRLLGEGRDDLNYLKREALLEILPIFLLFNISEPMYWAILSFSKNILGDVKYQFLLFSLIHLSVLSFVINRFSLNRKISFLIYLAFFFLLHGYTQIRISVAISLFLLLIHYIAHNKLKFSIGVLLAFMFHYSSLIYALFFFLKKNKISLYFYFLLPALGFLGSFVFDTYGSLQFFIKKIPLPGFLSNNLVEALEYEASSQPNPFNIIILFNLLVYYVSLINLKKITLVSPFSLLYLKIVGWSLFAFYAFMDVPVLAFRIFEMLNPVIILYLPIFLKIVKPKPLTISIFIVFTVFVGIKNYIYLFN